MVTQLQNPSIPHCQELGDTGHNFYQRAILVLFEHSNEMLCYSQCSFEFRSEILQAVKQ